MFNPSAIHLRFTEISNDKIVLFPNPFRNKIRIGIKTSSITGFSIIGLSGKEIYSGKQVRAVTWDGRDNHGGLVPSGTYILSIATDKGHESRRITLIR